MRHKRYALAFVLTCIAATLATAQTTDQWYEVDISGEATFMAPPALEIQAGNYKEKIDAWKRKHRVDESNVILQPTGVNDGSSEAINNYARVLVNLVTDPSTEFPGCGFDRTSIKKDVMDILTQSTDEEIAKVRGVGGTVKRVGRTEIYRTSKCAMVHRSYDRKSALKNKPDVRVHAFMVFGRRSALQITMSYRIDQESYWYPLYKQILETVTVR